MYITRLQERVAKIRSKAKAADRLTEAKIATALDASVVLRPYQITGVQWLYKWIRAQDGVILADQMGLGKTVQTIALLGLNLLQHREKSNPHLVVLPLSLLRNWKYEFGKFCSKVKVLTYMGNRTERTALRSSVKTVQVVLTSYDYIIRDAEYFSSVEWDTLVVDEAHRLKNSESKLYTILHEEVEHRKTVLLTGTPVQNNIEELFALLQFVAPSCFRLKDKERFVEAFQDVATSDKKQEVLQELLDSFILRRTLADLTTKLPPKSEAVLFTGLSKVQTNYYKAILMKNAEAFDGPGRKKVRLMNTLMQLRKCANHPYLFDGVEPEPFMLGEHLVEASGKLVVLDKMLQKLKKNGHRVLIFSQMTRMLDILQDYLHYRNYNYERLDGSVRGEERFAAISKFSSDDALVFLLSTRAGGLGLNLVAADTVILFDSDFNPQNDLQAIARAHRIGQKRPVKVFRLVAQHTAEEVILKRAEQKLKLTQAVMEGDKKDEEKDQSPDAGELVKILKFGLDSIMKEEEEETAKNLKELMALMGDSRNGEWIIEGYNSKDPKVTPKPETEATSESDSGTKKAGASRMDVDDDEDSDEVEPTIYHYMGEDYKTKAAADESAFDRLVALALDNSSGSEDDGPRLRRQHGYATVDALYRDAMKTGGDLPERPRKRKKELTPEEMEARKQAKIERAKKRKEAMERKKEQLRRQREERERKRLEAKKQFWEKNHYKSSNLPLNDEEDEIDEDEDEIERKELKFVVGDVTQPKEPEKGPLVILHCVDDSGSWGTGGLFSAIHHMAPEVEGEYETAAEMKDLALGDAHLIKLEFTRPDKSRVYMALVVAQTRDRDNRLTPIKVEKLGMAFRRISRFAKQHGATVHLPRIGHATPKFNWYATERLLRKWFSAKGVGAYVYYFKRKAVKPKPAVRDSTAKAKAAEATSAVPKLPSICREKVVYLHDSITGDARKDVTRLIITFDGDVTSTITDAVTHCMVKKSLLDTDEIKALVDRGIDHSNGGRTFFLEGYSKEEMNASLRENVSFHISDPGIIDGYLS